MIPVQSMVYVTLRCNSRCSYCSIWRDERCRATPDANPEDVMRNLRALKKLGVKAIDFTGGEPLLHRDLPDILREAKRLRLRTSVVTSGILYPQRAAELRGLTDTLVFSLDTLDTEEYRRIRGIDGLETVLESIDLAIATGQRPEINFTVTNENVGNLETLARFARERRILLKINPVFSYFENEALDRRGLEHIRSFFRRPYIYVNLAKLRLIERGGNDPRKPVCKAVSSTLVISPDNHLIVPCFHHELQRFEIRDNLVELYRSDEVVAYRAMQGRWPFCKGCTIWCYLVPSFLYSANRLFFLNLLSGMKYARDRCRRSIS